MTKNKILRMKDLPSRVGFAKSTIYELIKKNKFPKPFKIIPNGRASGWFENDIENWINNRASD